MRRVVVACFTSNEMVTLTFELHSDFEALLEPAKGTPFSLGFVYVAGSLGDARVNLLVLHSPFEEALAGLTREKAVVVTGHFVTANGTQFLDDFFSVGKFRGTRYRTRDHTHPRYLSLLLLLLLLQSLLLVMG